MEIEQKTHLAPDFFEGLPVGVLICDETGTIEETNTHLNEIFGYETGELIGQSLSILLPESVRAVHDNMMAGFFKKPQSKLMDRGRVLPGVRKDGRKLHLNIGLSFRRMPSGLHAIASVSNVTEKVEAEKKSESHRLLLNEIRELMLLHLENPSSNEVYYRMLSTFLDYTGSPLGFIGELDSNQEKLTVRAITDISWDDWSRNWMQGVDGGTASFTRMDSLYGFTVKNGKPVIANKGSGDPRSGGILPEGHTPVHSFLGIPLIYQGKTIALAAAANSHEPYTEEQIRDLQPLTEAMAGIMAGRRDYAKRIEGRRELEKQERRFRSLVENARDLIGVFDLDYRLVYSTPAQKNLLGYTHEDLSELDASQLIHPDDRARLLHLMEQLRNGEPVPADVRYRYRHKDGTYRILEGVFRLDEDIAEEPLIVINAKDITELEYYQTSLLRTVANLQSESAAKNRFMAKLSHEIRTPLNAILGLTDMLLRERMDSEHEQLLKVIHSSGDTLLRLLNDLLEATQLESEDLNLRMEPVRLRDVLEHTLLAYQFNASRHNRNLDFCISEAIPSKAIGDAGRIKQMVTNLVSNAIKYAENGHIQVLADLVPAHQEDHIRIRITVADTGPGIPEEQQENIFRIFSRVRRPGDDLVPGVGLGLYIVKQLTDKMGGSIQVFSPSRAMRSQYPECVGTDFILELELRKTVYEDESGPDLPEREPVFHSQPRILVAEDNPSNQILMERMLGEMNCSVKIVGDGESACKQATSEPYDLIILDINMPVLNGFEAARIIRSANSDVPIVALSAAAEDPSEEKLHAVGMTLYLVKPVWQKDLFRVIRELTGKD